MRFKFLLIAIGIIAGIIIILLFPHLVRSTYKVTVTNKQMVKRNNINYYYIYTETENGDLRVFEDANNFAELKFNSGDLYWTMEVNRKYEIRAYGINMPTFSHYQNIVKVKGIAK
ncbi:hypothetical protein HMPREF1982_01433 [Clostridiales bacterium oral taxon 876 str. F0540]|nr:hypothetical protein HMPREF1982_01433 [Clostridiales bacterium oral taxon 876 str. F0540]